ncbi:C40 family peptidase [Halocola ammonii]
MNGFGIVDLAVIPGRKEPRDSSEMVTQLLLGEVYSIEDEKEKWVQVKNNFDEYVCWIDKKQFVEITHAEFDEYRLNEFPRVTSFSSSGGFETGDLLLPVGAVLPFYGKGHFKIRNQKFQSDCKVSPISKEKIPEVAKGYLNTPYLWGGKTQWGIDCSGLVQVVFSLAGINLKRDAWQQAEQGETVAFIEEAETGDLAFFDNSEGRITHVGIVLDGVNGGKEIIHASGRVRINQLDHQGIYDRNKKRYTHQLRIIKRY